MRNKLLTVSVILVLVAVLFGVGSVLAETLLPRVKTACESPLGGILSKDNGDGFNRIKACPKGMREVALGEELTSTGGGAINVGNVAFVADDVQSNKAVWVLRTDGTAWFMDTTYGMERLWINDQNRDLPIIDGKRMSVGEVASWSHNVFITKEGVVYLKPADGPWSKIDVQLPTVTPTP